MRGSVAGMICVLGVLGFVASACEPGLNLTIRNETETTVTIWEMNSRIADLGPGEGKTYSLIDPGITTYRAVDPEGNVLLDKTFSSTEELEDYGDIVVTERPRQFSVRNETGTTVTIWRDQMRVSELGPGEGVTFSGVDFPGTSTYRALDPEGNALFEGKFTLGELISYGDIVVTNERPAPTTSPSPS